MKKFRRTASLLLAIAMVFALSVTAFAAAPDSEANGTITITGAVDGQTYSIYRIFDLESYSGDAYSYKVNDTWGEWARTQATQYVKVDDQGYVTWVEGAAPAEFAKLALEYAKAQKIKPDATPVTAKADGTVVFDKLPLGYYLVDSSLGALCGLNTTNSSVNIKEKNTAPTIDKQVQEGDQWGDTNDAKIGDTVNFKTVVHAQPGAENYVVHDTMSEGLTLKPETVQIAGLTKDTDYTVDTQCVDNCTFEIKFTKTYLDTITADTPITITYSAVLNDKAVIAGEGNTNETYLSYGDSSHTEVAKTATKTYQFQLVKTDQDKKVLEGAQFELYDAQTEGNKIDLVKVGDTNTYRVATAAEKAAPGFTSAKIQAGQATIQGLDGNTTYYLQETKAPDGYNKLKDRHEVPLQEANLDATVNAGTDVYEKGGVHVINKTGAELPSTGGIGTTVFYVVGGVMVAAAVILLITKKRMGSAE